jgi:3-oxoacyl-[acyl-carrier protein] reductase
MRLHEKVAIVSGGSRGIGKAIAIGMALEGAKVVVCYRGAKDEANQVVDEICSKGGIATPIQMDVTSKIDREKLIQKTLESFGRINILVNNAGVISWHKFFDATEEEWNRQFDVNLKGPFFLSLEVAKEMIKIGGGSIINIGSTAGYRVKKSLSIYSLTKAGIAMLTQQLAYELGPHQIRVNCILPGTTETDINREALSEPGNKQSQIDETPLGRLGEAQDHVGAAVFLGSDESNWITGLLMPIDGGNVVL